MIQLRSKEQWVTRESTVEHLHKTAVDKHKRVVQDLQQLADAMNQPPSSVAGNLLPILHPNDSTSGIFPLTGPTAIQIRIAGVAILTIDANGMRMGP